MHEVVGKSVQFEDYWSDGAKSVCLAYMQPIENRRRNLLFGYLSDDNATSGSCKLCDGVNIGIFLFSFLDRKNAP